MELEVEVSEKRYMTIRKQLDELGYRYHLPLDSVPLVENLLSDLLHTTESLRYYKELSENSLKDRDLFEHGLEPYKAENAKLVKECNALHLKVLQVTEEAEKTRKELKHRIQKLGSENADLSFLNSKFISQIKQLERESAEKSQKIIHLQSKNSQATVVTAGGKKKSVVTHQPTLEIDEPLTPAGKSWRERYASVCAQVKDPYIANMVDCMDQRVCLLTREVTNLKQENLQQMETIATMKAQLTSREKEIDRLESMLEGGRPLSAIKKDCCYKELEKQVLKSTNEIKRLEGYNQELEMKLRESVANQHEAMSRALQLAERNKQLQNEMRDIDRMALAVEAECSTTVKENTRKVSQIQEKLEASLSQINDLEREILELKRNNQELQADLEACRHEKKNIRKVLETALDEKKKLTDRINNFTVIEHDLTVEIDRLTRTVNQQKRRIAELEANNTETISGKRASRLPPSSRKGNSHDDLRIPASVHSMSLPAEYGQRSKRPVDGFENKGDGIEKDLFEQLRSERDYYSKAYTNLKEQLKNSPDQSDENIDLRRKLNEKEQEVIKLQQASRELKRENARLQGQIEELQARETHDGVTSPGMENHGYAVKLATETQVYEHARLEKTVIESEDRMRMLEAERRELLTSQGALKAAVSSLEDKVSSHRDQLHTSQSELSQQRILYNQLKSMHDQSERSLADAHGRLTQFELELANAQERVRELERDRANLDREVATLRNERTVMRGKIAQLDQEKDGLIMNLDSKTEQAAMLEQEWRGKDNRILDLEEQLTELQKKMDITLDENGAREQALRAAERETEALRMELDTVERARESTLRENRRLQDDLASATQDVRTANRELEAAREEVDNLKRQLQEYVSEIRRVEELLAQKETERSEMLEHFRGLSMEATLLESNNHSLESEALEKKTQLRQAEDRIQDLEQQLELKDSLVRSYENQITELTSHIACLETQLQQHSEQRRKMEADLIAVRDICSKLDAQKDQMMQQIADGDVMKIQLERELTRIRDEQDLMQDHLNKDRGTINNLESMLATSRQETVEQKIQNQELQSEVMRLRQKVEDLKNRLESESTELRRYQHQAAEYSQQVADLQRQITNERFEQAMAADERRSYSTTL